MSELPAGEKISTNQLIHSYRWLRDWSLHETRTHTAAVSSDPELGEKLHQWKSLQLSLVQIVQFRVWSCIAVPIDHSRLSRPDQKFVADRNFHSYCSPNFRYTVSARI